MDIRKWAWNNGLHSTQTLHCGETTCTYLTGGQETPVSSLARWGALDTPLTFLSALHCEVTGSKTPIKLQSLILPDYFSKLLDLIDIIIGGVFFSNLHYLQTVN